MVNNLKPIQMTNEERSILISHLTDELPVLRTKLGLSQDEMGALVGISRQTYSAIETKKRKMTWSIYLSLILVFDNNRKTHEFIRNQGLFPSVIFDFAETGDKEQLVASFVDNDDIKEKLDDQAIHAIKTVIMVEYARCNNMSSEAVIKAFSGNNYIENSHQDFIAKKALATIKAKSNGQ